MINLRLDIVFAIFHEIFRRAVGTEYLGYENMWEVFIRRRKGRESHAEKPRRSGLSCVLNRVRDAPRLWSFEGDERERESSIYFRLPVPSRSGMIYAERVPRLRAAGEFSLSAPHPAVSPGWRSVPLSSPLPSGPFLRREDRDASFSDDMQLPAIVLFFPSSVSLLERFRGRQANHRATTSRLSYVRFEWTTCGFVQFVRNESMKSVRSLILSSRREIWYNLVTLRKINWCVYFTIRYFLHPIGWKIVRDIHLTDIDYLYIFNFHRLIHLRKFNH